MRYFLALALLSSAFAQQTSPPPEVDKALRERVKKFYQLHVEGKFRLLDPLIADESKDDYYEASKGKYMKYDDPMIEYSDNFTKAVVKTPVTQEWRYPRLGTMIVHPTVPTTWKIENGLWVYYMPKEGLKATPFGVADLTKQNDDYKGAPADGLNIKKISVTEVLGAVTVDKQNVELSSYKNVSDEVIITNEMPGQVNLELQYPPMPGLEVSLERKELQGAEKTKLILKYTPPDPSPKAYIDVAVQILQTGKTIPIRVVFAVPAGSPAEPKPKGKI